MIRGSLLSQSSDPFHQVEPRAYGGQLPNWTDSTRKAAPEHARIRGPPPETLRRGQGSCRPHYGGASAARKLRHTLLAGLVPSPKMGRGEPVGSAAHRAAATRERAQDCGKQL